MLGLAESRLRNTSSELMERPTLALRECKQGSLGDCYLVAATGAAINRDPMIISKMITMSPDHTSYIVRYPDGNEVRVPALTEGEIAMGGAATKNGLWLRILEKAWGVRKISGSKKLDPGAEPIDAMGHGGSIRSTLEAMTGHKAVSFRLGNTKQGANVTPDRLRMELTEAIKDHRLIGAATPSVVTVPGISPNHAYAILGYEADTDRVNVWNPHVNRFTPKDVPGLTAGYTTSEGMFSMPLSEFIATYSAISIESPGPRRLLRKLRSRRPPPPPPISSFRACPCPHLSVQTRHPDSTIREKHLPSSSDRSRLRRLLKSFAPRPSFSFERVPPPVLGQAKDLQSIAMPKT